MNNCLTSRAKEIPWLAVINSTVLFSKSNPASILSFINQRKWVQAFLRWEAVRQSTHPIFFDNQYRTGFEGYFVGSDLTAIQVATEIAQIGAKHLRCLCNHHSAAYSASRRIKKRLLSLLDGDTYDGEALTEASTILGAICGQLRPKVSINETCARFRAETERIVGTASYHLEWDGSRLIGHRYSFHNDRTTLPSDYFAGDPCTVLSTDLCEGFTFMLTLGKVGIPIIRWLNERQSSVY